METDPVKRVKLAAFLKKIHDNHLCAGWRDGDDLPGKVTVDAIMISPTRPEKEITPT